MSADRSKRSYGTVCCVPDCKNNTKFNRNVSWHTFPKDIHIRKQWILRINCRPTGKQGKFSKWSPSNHHRICGAHFNEHGRKKYEDKLPYIFPRKLYSPMFLLELSRRT